MLLDRKQNPSKKWLKELLYRARIVENQLYQTAPSLKAYLDETTLKYRVKKAAHTITSQFQIGKGKLSSSSESWSRAGISNPDPAVPLTSEARAMILADELQRCHDNAGPTTRLRKKTIVSIFGEATLTGESNPGPAVPLTSEARAMILADELQRCHDNAGSTTRLRKKTIVSIFGEATLTSESNPDPTVPLASEARATISADELHTCQDNTGPNARLTSETITSIFGEAMLTSESNPGLAVPLASEARAIISADEVHRCQDNTGPNAPLTSETRASIVGEVMLTGESNPGPTVPLTSEAGATTSADELQTCQDNATQIVPSTGETRANLSADELKRYQDNPMLQMSDPMPREKRAEKKRARESVTSKTKLSKQPTTDANNHDPSQAKSDQSDSKENKKDYSNKGLSSRISQALRGITPPAGERLYGRTRTWSVLSRDWGLWMNLFISRNPTTRVNPEPFRLKRGGVLTFVPDLVSNIAPVKEEMEQCNEFREYTFRARMHLEPRVHVLYSSRANAGNTDVGYKYHSVEMKALPLDTLEHTSRLAEQLAREFDLPNAEWNIGLDLLIYRDGQDGINWHGDNTQEEEVVLCLVTESQEDTRTLCIQPCRNQLLEDGDEQIELFPEAGDAYQMDGTCIVVMKFPHHLNLTSILNRTHAEGLRPFYHQDSKVQDGPRQANGYHLSTRQGSVSPSRFRRPYYRYRCARPDRSLRIWADEGPAYGRRTLFQKGATHI